MFKYIAIFAILLPIIGIVAFLQLQAKNSNLSEPRYDFIVQVINYSTNELITKDNKIGFSEDDVKFCTNLNSQLSVDQRSMYYDKCNIVKSSLRRYSISNKTYENISLEKVNSLNLSCKSISPDGYEFIRSNNYANQDFFPYFQNNISNSKYLLKNESKFVIVQPEYKYIDYNFLCWVI
jgi:hypothetical protein